MKRTKNEAEELKHQDCAVDEVKEGKHIVSGDNLTVFTDAGVSVKSYQSQPEVG